MKMTSAIAGNRLRRTSSGFALIATLSVTALLTILTIGLLSLSQMSSRSARLDKTQAEAQANARLALMVALANLQREMGPDMRVSVEAALFDQNPATPETDGVAQPHWMATYDAWGDWLNTSYRRSDGSPALTIGQTYTPRRSPMFRRWMLSVPPALERNDSAPLALNGWNDTNSKIMVGQGTLGQEAETRPEKVTRAYLNPMGTNGLHAWWIGPENHKARIDKSKVATRASADAAAWETSQNDTSEVGVGGLPGFGAIDSDGTTSERMLTLNSLGLAGIAAGDINAKFYDLTANSQGVLSSTRTGALKRDLSLLFELNNAGTSTVPTPPEKRLPSPYAYNPGPNTPEPSIRPMSPDLLAQGPRITARHFASWMNMRHYYRMYRTSVDASTRGTGAPGALRWSRSQPFSDAQIPIYYRDTSNANFWNGDNAYLRLPLLAKLTFIYSLMTERVTPNSTTDLRHRLLLVYTPVYTYWNPYNVELRIPDRTMGCLSSTYQVLPMRTQFYLQNTATTDQPGSLFTGNAHSFLRSSNGGEIVFKPGEFKVFSHPNISAQSGGQGQPLDLVPGFNPMGYGGDRLQLGVRNETERPGVAIQFSHSEWGGNVSYGNTPGSLCHTPFWLSNQAEIGSAFQYNYPVMYQNDWFNLAQTYTPLSADPLPVNRVATRPENILRWVYDGRPVPVAYSQLVLKGFSEFDYETISWAKDWRSRNWIQAPPFYFGNSMYISETEKIAHTQRLDNAYVMNFGPMSSSEMPKVVAQLGERGYLGSGASPYEQVTAVPAVELPTAPVGSLAGFSGMRINPGWAHPKEMNPDLNMDSVGGNDTRRASFAFATCKTLAYQSGVTGPGIGNSFLHPMIPRANIYQYFNNSVSADPANRTVPLDSINFNDNKVFCDYWDHVFLLNDALWDDYFVSSLADQKRPGASSSVTLSENIDNLTNSRAIANSRYRFRSGSGAAETVKAELTTADGYLKAAKYLMVDGMFNVNSTSVAAWYSLFAGIRERQLVYRDTNGTLRKISVPDGKKIAISRFNTDVTDREMNDPGSGVNLSDGWPAWSGVRYLSDEQLLKLAEECVKQVKLRGPFLNFSEFINRRLSNDELGLRGPLQAAIDYDDANPDSRSINFNFKKNSRFLLKANELGDHAFATPEAAEGSRFAGIPGYVIQSDLLKPIANTLSVRDDTFRIRTYGEVRDRNGRTVGRAWCEAIVQRVPDYVDPTNDASVPARLMSTNGVFSNNPQLTVANRQFGRKFRIESFRWLNADEI